MRILVTGGAGRLGRSVVHHLAETGHEVISVDRRLDDSLPARQIIADLSDPGQTWSVISDCKPDAVIHLAAIAIPFSAPESEIFRVNVLSTFSVVEASVGVGVPRILIATSPTPIGYGAPNGWEPQTLPIDEEHPMAPWNAYALSKSTMESIVRMFAAGDNTSKIHAFRPCFVIAPEEWDDNPTQVGHTVSERLDRPELAAVSLFNYIDARDAAEFVGAWLRGADSIPSGEVFFVGAADAMARQPLSELFPQFFPGTEVLAAGLTGTSPAFSSEKAARLLGWVPKRSWRTEMKG